MELDRSNVVPPKCAARIRRDGLGQIWNRKASSALEGFRIDRIRSSGYPENPQYPALLSVKPLPGRIVWVDIDKYFTEGTRVLGVVKSHLVGVLSGKGAYRTSLGDVSCLTCSYSIVAV